MPRPPSLVLLLSLLALSPTADAFERGLHFDPDRNGHGFGLERVGTRWVLVFYSYDAGGLPEWFLSVAEEHDGRLGGPLDRFRYLPGASPPQQLERTAGEFTLAEPGGSCGEGRRFSWTLDDSAGSWCVQPLIGASRRPEHDLGGLWFAEDPADVGWGLTLDFGVTPEGREEVAAVVFHYDAEGLPRWSLGVGVHDGDRFEVPLDSFLGYCRACGREALAATQAGTLSLALGSELGRPLGLLDLDLAYPGTGGGDWSRRATSIQPLSDPQPGAVPAPEAIPANVPVAFWGATVLPMTGDPEATLTDHVVLVRDGQIAAVSPRATALVPPDAWRIDARGAVLMPGLSEMHLHLSVGGQQAAEEAGLLMIANGVTTAFNVGDAFAVDVPELAARYASPDLVGPTLLTANVAYGPSDGADPGRTIRNGQEAIAYAQRLFEAGYDYLKVYWGVGALPFRFYVTEGERYGMPVIGHLPLQQSMERSLSGGQVMAVHVQEPFVTFMGRVQDRTLIRPAAELFLTHGSYLTPTLAVFESYTSIYGGDVDAYQTLIQRPGAEYTPIGVRNVWRSYFNGGFIQGNGQVPGALDAQFAFFLAIADGFDEAGVPLLVGTDAPGFPGVMSGYGAIEELRLFVRAGIDPADALAAATRNAGRFVDDTLAPEIGFGMIEPGRRADLVLLAADPRVDIERLTDRLGVMVRGEWYSATELEARLAGLAAGRKASAPPVGDPPPPFCADHLLY